MSRARLFKRTDVTRAAVAVREAGFDVQRIEIDRDGRIIVIPGRPGEQTSLVPAPENPWDEVG
jgi:hypothetical protein